MTKLVVITVAIKYILFNTQQDKRVIGYTLHIHMIMCVSMSVCVDVCVCGHTYTDATNASHIQDCVLTQPCVCVCTMCTIGK